MEKTTNEKLIDWISRKAVSEYAGDISMVLLYGSYVNGTFNKKSDLDCYFIPKTERGYQMAVDFIIDGVGYDIFSMDWERVERIANLEETLTPLVGDVKVLYAASEGDLERFRQMQEKLKANLQNDAFVRSVAAKRVAFSHGLYTQMIHADSLSEIRKLAGHIIMFLADAAAVFQHGYYPLGLKTQFQELQSRRGIPSVISGEYLRVVESHTAEEAICHCHRMLSETASFVGAELPEDTAVEHTARESGGSPVNFSELAGLYEEISSTFQKIYLCCETGNYILAFLSAACLQRELDDAHTDCGAASYDILSSYDHQDLRGLCRATHQAEDDFVTFIADGGGMIKRYASFEEFELARL